MIRIVYAGVGMGGKHSSLACLMQAAGEPVCSGYDLLDPSDEYCFQWRHSSSVYEVHATVSSTRAILYYEYPASAEVDPRVNREIDALVASDAIVFVVDSQRARLTENIGQMTILRRDLESRGIHLGSKLVVVQANKRDLNNLLSVREIRDHFGVSGMLFGETIATENFGVPELMTRAFDRIVAMKS